LNASRFALTIPPAGAGAGTEPVDRALLSRLRLVVAAGTEAYQAFDPARALESTEAFFWTFCDDYVELVKDRAYHGGPGGESARRTLRLALDVLLRLFAPVLPFVTEEIWSWWREGSVHRAPWPAPRELPDGGDPGLIVAAGEVLAQVRRAKTNARLSMRAPVTTVVVRDSAENLSLVRLAEADLCNAGVVAQLILVEGERSVEVVLADEQRSGRADPGGWPKGFGAGPGDP
jgi:valyl-tRNA synthetase